MSSKKPETPQLPADATLAYPVDGAEIPAADPADSVRTKDRDPADREQWKRERAKALGHTR